MIQATLKTETAKVPGMEKDLSMKKEVLTWLVNGLYADSLNQAIKNQNPKSGLKAQNIFYLRAEIRDAKTEEELEAINEKLKGYSFDHAHNPLE